MSAKLPILNIGAAGVNTDMDPAALAPEWFTNGINFQLKNGKIYTYGGDTLIASAPSGFGGVVIIAMPVGDSYSYIVMGATAIWLFNGSTWTNITPALFTGSVNATLWTACLLGNIAVLNHPAVGPFYYYSGIGGGLCLPLPWTATQTWQAANKYCYVMRSCRNFLFAMNMVESGVQYLNSYRWSNPAVNNGIPSTWDILDLAAIAGQANILGDGGSIIDGAPLRSAFVIYCTKQITVLTYVGGTYIWNAAQLSNAVGLLTTNCIANIFTKHVFISEDDILITDGNSIGSIMDQRLRAMIVGQLDATSYHSSFAAYNSQTKEVWICVPQVGHSAPNIAFLYSSLHDTIAIRNIAHGITGIAFGPVNTTTTTWDSDSPNTWDYDSTDWNYDTSSLFGAVVLGVAAGALYDLSQKDNSAPSGLSLTRQTCALNAEDTMNTAVAIYPLVTCSGPIMITVGAQEYYGAPIVWQPSLQFDPATDYKVDFESTGKLHSWNISTIGTNDLVLSGLTIEYVPNGVR